jgi:hypothetical protein
MRFETQSKWRDFLDGFHCICSALDSYNAGDKWGYGEFWEDINVGWFDMYIYPYDDLYHPHLSDERVLRIGK